MDLAAVATAEQLFVICAASAISATATPEANIAARRLSLSLSQGGRQRSQRLSLDGPGTASSGSGCLSGVLSAPSAQSAAHYLRRASSPGLVICHIVMHMHVLSCIKQESFRDQSLRQLSPKVRLVRGQENIWCWTHL